VAFAEYNNVVKAFNRSAWLSLRLPRFGKCRVREQWPIIDGLVKRVDREPSPVSLFHTATILVLVAVIDDRERESNTQSSDRLD
jgi:hypothetical protein